MLQALRLMASTSSIAVVLAGLNLFTIFVAWLAQ
jgi:hypothetical protein